MQPYRMPEGKHIGLQVLTFSLVTAGFFAVHSAAAGSLNRKLAEGRGRANSLYVLFYYLGGWVGITASGRAYQFAGWRAVAGMGILMLVLPFATGFAEMRERKQEPGGGT